MNPADKSTKPCKSFAQVQAVWQSALPRAEKVVLQVLLAYARPDLSVSHAQAELAWKGEYTEHTVSDALKALKAAKIVTEAPGHGRAPYRATAYQIDLRHLPTRSSSPPRTRPFIHATDGGPPPITENHIALDKSNLSTRDVQTRNHVGFETEQNRALTTQTPNDGPQTPTHFAPKSIKETKKKKKFFSHARNRTAVEIPPRVPKIWTLAPDTIPITEELRAWADENTPDVNLVDERDKWLQHCRGNGYRFSDWPKEFQFFWLPKAQSLRPARKAQYSIGHQRAPAPTRPYTDGNSHISARNQQLLEKFRLTPEEERQLQASQAEYRAAIRAQDEAWQAAGNERDRPAARPPADGGTAPAEHLAKVIPFPGPSNVADPAAGSPSNGACPSQALLNALGVSGTDGIASRVVALLGLALKARQAQQLTAETFAVLKQRLCQATSEAALDAIAAEIPGAGRHEQPSEA